MNNLLNELNSLKSNLDNLPIMNLSDLDLNNTDLFIVDINNGFAKGGALYSPRIESLINPSIKRYKKYNSFYWLSYKRICRTFKLPYSLY